ncbi:MAG: hypothetical protein NVS4B3_21870 [Gemmatimonadaceae bacterium]
MVRRNMRSRLNARWVSAARPGVRAGAAAGMLMSSLSVCATQPVHLVPVSTLADAMSDYWVAFATSGDPNGPPTGGKWPRWPAYDARTDPYLDLGPEVVAKRALRSALYDSIDVRARARGEVRP